MKVLAIIPDNRDPKGVSFVHALREVEAVRQQGADVKVHAMNLKRNPLRVLPEWIRLRQVIAEFQPDLIHVQVGGPVGLLSILSTLRPRVVTYRGSELNPCPQMNPIHWGVHWICSQLVGLLASGTICVSQELKSRLWWARGPVKVLPSGVDTSHFVQRPLEEARQHLNWPIDEPIVMFNASLSPDVKRLDRAEAAFSIVQKSFPKARMEVMRGQVSPNDVPCYLSAADVLLVTSDLEGSPAIVQEALACGLPVVTVPVGDVAEVLADVTPSWIVPPDPERLAVALEEALKNRQRSNGPLKAESLSCKSNAKQLLQFYRGLL